MKNMALRLTSMVVLGVLLFAGLLPGKTPNRNGEEITVHRNPEPEEIYITVRSAKARRQEEDNSLMEVEFTTDTAQKLTAMHLHLLNLPHLLLPQHFDLLAMRPIPNSFTPMR